MTPFEQLCQDLETERMRSTPRAPRRLPHAPLQSLQASDIEIAQLVADVEGRADRAQRDRLRRRERILTDAEIEAI